MRWRRTCYVGSDVTLSCITASGAPVDTRWFYRDADEFEYHEITANSNTVCIQLSINFLLSFSLTLIAALRCTYNLKTSRIAQFTGSGQNLTVWHVSWDKRIFSFGCFVTNQYGNLWWDYLLNVHGASPKLQYSSN